MSFESLSGGCSCERVRYDLVADPITLYACHCTDCQTETGTSFALSMFAHRDSIVLTRGEPRPSEYLLPDGRERRSQRCPDCNVVLWGNPRRFPELLNLQPGTLDDTTWLRPVGHIWTRSRQPWVAIPADALCYESQPEDILPLVRAWKNRAD